MSNSIKPILPALKLADLPDTELAVYAQEKLDKLTGNSAYPAIAAFPELQGMSDALDAYRLALAKAEDGSTVDVADKDAKRTLLEASLMTLATRCVQLSLNDRVVFLSSGFEIKKERSPASKPERPDAMAAADGHTQGEIRLNWSSVEGAVTYHVEMTETPEADASWKPVPVNKGGVTTRAHTQIGGLQPGRRYWFRAAGFNSAGLGEWSEPATRISQ